MPSNATAHASAPTKTSALRHALHVIWYRAMAELRAEATRTYAGYLWWIINPLLMFLVYFVAFKYVLSSRKEHFATFLFTGIVLWQWFLVSVQRCAGSLIATQSLMQQVNLHKAVFPYSIILVNTVKFSVTLLILLCVLVGAGFYPGGAWLALPAVLLVELLVIAAFGCFSAMISPFIPDFQYILMTVLQLLFFLSGIIYELSVLPDRLQLILRLNPMAVVLGEARTVLMHNQFPDWSALLLPIAEAGVVLAVSMALLHRFDKVYPKIG